MTAPIRVRPRPMCLFSVTYLTLNIVSYVRMRRIPPEWQMEKPMKQSHGDHKRGSKRRPATSNGCVKVHPDRSITPYMRTRDSIHRKNSPFYGPERFTYQPESNGYRCPAGQQLNYGGRSMRNRTYVFIGTRKRCGACAQRPQCTSAAFRCLAIHMEEPARQRARQLVNTPEFAHAQRQRKKVEALFAELKNQIGLRRLRLRRLKFVREQFFLAAAAQNIKRLVRFLSQPTTPTLKAAS
jgi:hypothetical protein